MSKPTWITLSDGRRLCYAEWGDPQGTPYVLMHGWPGSRLAGRLVDGTARWVGARLVAPDRPGIGQSDFQPRRALLDWPRDVAALADAMALDQFGVIGVSGGAAYALACAHELGDRVTQVTLASGMGPLESPEAKATLPPQVRTLFALNHFAPSLSRLSMTAMALTMQHLPKALLGQMRRAAPPADRAVLTGPTFEALIEEYAEAFRQGAEGVTHEISINGGPWGFDLSAITHEVHLYHSAQDANVPIALARQVARALPGCRAHYVREAGHFWFIENFDKILRQTD